MKRVAMLLTVLAVSLTIAWVSGCSQQKKSVLLRLKYEPGQTRVFEIDRKHHWMYLENDTVTREGTYEIDITAEETTRRILEEGTAEVVQTTTRHIYEPNEEDSSLIDTVTTTRSITLYLRPDGRLVDLEFGNIESMDTAYIRQFYEQASTVFPQTPVEQGKTWSHSTHVMLNGENVEAVTTYELKSFARERGYDCAVISYEGELLLPISAKPADTTKRGGLDEIDVSGMMYFAYTEGVSVSVRERWLINSERTMLKDGEWTTARTKIEVDAEQQLVDAVQ
ncbi:hypothetical protein GF420_02750 [candidate division GN15 bacterium]|nr:hypothetical protein [candidate division GN15 bacterium]